MYELDDKYIAELEDIAASIQESEILQQYLEEEEEDFYRQLKDIYEPQIGEVYNKVAAENPLQLIHLELVLLDENFEGLFLPKILGYSVLRGEIGEDFRYVRPQEHFKEILLTICQSPNFEMLRKRIGQTVQMGFALSSDIWVTNLINRLDNKRIRYYLQGQKLDKFRDPADREEGYARYMRQFRKENFLTANFPQEKADLILDFPSLKKFLIYRASQPFDNSSLSQPIREFLTNEDFFHTLEHLETLILAGAFFEEEAQLGDLQDLFARVRKKYPDLEEHFFHFLLELHDSEELDLRPKADLRLAKIVGTDGKSDLSGYFKLLELLHKEGIDAAKVQEAMKSFTVKYEGLSKINECVRRTVFGYFVRHMHALDEESYPQFFELSRLFPIYIDLFANEQFTLGLKDLSMDYVARLLKTYTDKRGKDYQDIKKFVSTTFQDLGFLTEKEIVELFKTRRKKKTAA